MKWWQKLGIIGVLGLTSASTAAAQTSAETQKQKNKVETVKKAPASSSQKADYDLTSSPREIKARTWLKTQEGKEMLEAYQNALATYGDTVTTELTDVSEIEALRELSKMPSTIAAVTGGNTDYEFDAEDLLSMKSDSMALVLSKDAVSHWITPDNIEGGFCAHAYSGLINEHGLGEGIFQPGTNGLAYAAQAADLELESPNFVKAKLCDWKDTDKIPEGVGCATKEGTTLYGHIWTSAPNSEGKTKTCTIRGKEVSYTVMRDISDKNRDANTSGNRGSSGQQYGDGVLIIPAGSTISKTTQMKMYVREIKNEYINNSYVLKPDIELSDIHISITPKMLLEKAREAKKMAFANYNGLNQNGDHMTYAQAVRTKMPLVAKNARHKGASTSKKAKKQTHQKSSKRGGYTKARVSAPRSL